ncbi:MAG: HD domain-containing protein [Gammaproteobacteria bacterium]|nr:HD domain-containing protein [Gammaproteobacteria bacterium]
MTEDQNFEHADAFGFLNLNAPLREKLVAAHRTVQQSLPFIARIALTLYDPETRLLKSYLHSSEAHEPMEHYQAIIDSAPSLVEMLKRGRPRVINNMLTIERGEQEHSQRIGREGYVASYTLPMFNNGDFIGFLFFNSFERDVFSEPVLRQLDLYGHLISLMVINELSNIHTLSAALKTTGHITHHRDPETGSHLDRMSRYSRLIARGLSGRYQLDDDYIEHIFMFSPLHDIGKIAIPDRILLKPGRLTDDEMSIMRTHPLRGQEMIVDLLANFGLENTEYVDMLRNIAVYHHEAVNGRGYPEGRSGDEIPLEARIVAVADVFDALTSRRPYKEAWDNERAFETLRKMAGEQLDQDCVMALLSQQEEIETIQQQFRENVYG